MQKILILIFLITIGCSNNKVVKNHGLASLELKSQKIIILKTNKNDVIREMGNPSSRSLFDENIWFYIQREKVNQSIIKLGKSKINKNNVLELTFNDYGILKSKKLYQIDKMKNVKIEKENTITKYNKDSYFGRLLKSIRQKIDSPTQTKRRN